MTLENQALHLENERLETENAGLTAEIARLRAERDQYKADYKRAHDKCNRMCVSAALEDIHGRAGDR